MSKSRLEAFSDGVIAILITIMVLGLTVPKGTTLADVRPVLPELASYVLSFIFLGIYWNNHHHLFQAVQQVDGGVLWANLHLLFWLSLVPFVSNWMGSNPFTAVPAAMYGVVMSLAGVAYYILVHVLLRRHSADSVLARAVGSDFKGRISVVLCLAAILAALFNPIASYALYGVLALIWLVPDRRIEKRLVEKDSNE